MKKLVALILIFILVLGMVGCGGKEDDTATVRDALQGTWVANWSVMGKDLNRYFTFKDDTYTTGGKSILGALDRETGKYEIEESSIHFVPDDGSESFDLDYSYNKDLGTIILWWNDEIQFERGQVSIDYNF